ncbi:MAG: SH3 domain-containing protein [Caldilineales bacterium]|nr:SH3 domain-containing protein [Caldilineales bacterium]
MQSQRLPIALLIILLLLVSAACSIGGSAEPEVAPTPRPTLHPTFTPTPVLPTSTPTEAPPTPEPPTPTPEVVVEEPTQAPEEVATKEPTPEEAPTEAPTPTSQPAQVEVTAPTVNLRGGPGTNYNRVGQVSRGQVMDIVGKNTAGDWWQVIAPNDQIAWIINSSQYTRASGDVNAVAVAENIPTVAPRPTSPPRPTTPPQPTNTPAPVYQFTKLNNDPRPNSNPIVTFFGGLYNSALDLARPVTGYKMVVVAPTGERKEVEFGAHFLRGDPGLAGEFLYNAKIEFPAADGLYRVYVADGGGAQVAEAWESNVSGQTRTFLPRWKQN